MNGIKIATLRSGLSSHVIRMWEKRYNAITPDRTETNRRVYSDASLERLVLLADLTRAGHSIGQIAHLTDAELSSLQQPSPEQPTKVQDGSPVIDKCLKAIQNLDQAALDKIFDREVKKIGYSGLLEKLLIPLIQKVGDAWHNGDFTTAQEHAATCFIKDYLCVTARSFPAESNAPKLLITTPPGQLHEMGAVIAASQARKLGWHVIYLGASLPPDEIAGAAEKVNAKAIALSIVYPLDDPQINTHLRRLRAQLDPSISLIVGGAESKLYLPTLAELGITHLKNMAELSLALTKLRKTI